MNFGIYILFFYVFILIFLVRVVYFLYLDLINLHFECTIYICMYEYYKLFQEKRIIENYCHSNY